MTVFVFVMIALAGAAVWYLAAARPWRHGHHEAPRRAGAASPAPARDPFWGSMDLDAERELHHEPWPEVVAPDVGGWISGPCLDVDPADPAMDGVRAALELGRARVWAEDRVFDEIIARNWP